MAGCRLSHLLVLLNEQPPALPPQHANAASRPPIALPPTIQEPEKYAPGSSGVGEVGHLNKKEKGKKKALCHCSGCRYLLSLECR